MSLIAVILNRNTEDWSWVTHSGMTLRDSVTLNNAVAKAKKKKGKGTGDSALDAFNKWAQEE